MHHALRISVREGIRMDRDDTLHNLRGAIHHTESFGAVDGPGIRFVFFMQGCPLRCLYCHNPDSIPMEGGTTWTVDEAAQEAIRYKSFIHKGGVTFSGGEPLVQAAFVRAVSEQLHREGLHVAIDTAGLPVRGDVQRAIDEADLLLLDIKAEDPVIAKALTGRDTSYALETLDYCEKINKPVWIRHVLLRGYTLDDSQLTKLADRLSCYHCIERVELLPFHKLGEPKWESMGIPYQLADTPATNREELERAKEIFLKKGFVVQ